MAYGAESLPLRDNIECINVVIYAYGKYDWGIEYRNRQSVSAVSVHGAYNQNETCEWIWYANTKRFYYDYYA